MGARKQQRAVKIKEAKSNMYFAKLKNCPTSPRKMRLVADLIRGISVDSALQILKYNPREASHRLEKLLLSAIASWQTKNEGIRIEESRLYIKYIYVDSARQLKRFRPAPHGRAHRIRKRSTHVTLGIDSANEPTINKL